MKENLAKDGQNKSKVKYLVDNKEHITNGKPYYMYLEHLTKDKARTMFMARTRMLNAKANCKKERKKDLVSIHSVVVTGTHYVIFNSLFHWHAKNYMYICANSCLYR